MHTRTLAVVAISCLLCILLGASTVLAQTGTLTAEPNPCTVIAPSNSCTVYVTWNVVGSTSGVVTVQDGSGTEEQFASGTSGTNQELTALPGHQYTLVLYDGVVAPQQPFGKWLDETLVLVMGTGTLTADPDPCLLASGDTSCTTYLTWTTDNVSSAVVTQEDAEGGGEIDIAQGKNGQDFQVTLLPYPHAYTFRLYDTSYSGERLEITATEVLATSAGISADPNPCPMNTGATSCTATVSWNSAVTTVKVTVEDTSETPSVETQIGTNQPVGHTDYAIAGYPHRYTFRLYDTSDPGAEPQFLSATEVIATGRGVVSGAPDPCEIASGSTTCDVTISWSTDNVQAFKVTVKDTYIPPGGEQPAETDFASEPATSKVASLEGPPHVWVFTLYDTTWGPAEPIWLDEFQVTITGLASLSANPNPCTIVSPATSCSSLLTWDTTNVTNPKLTVQQPGQNEAVISVDPSGTLNRTILAPPEYYIFRLYDAAASDTDPQLWVLLSQLEVVAEVSNSRTLTVLKDGTGTGTVTSVPAGIDCGATCAASYAVTTPATSVTLTASADADSTFASWSGCGTTSGNTCTVGMSTTREVVAAFNLKPTYTLTVSKSGTGSGTVTSSPDGKIDCGSTCSASYISGTSVTLSPAASVGSNFDSWSGACVGTGTCTVTMDSAKSVTASFTLIPDTTAPTVSITEPASGSTISGSVTVSVSASDNTAVVGVQYKLDGVNLGAETTSPYVLTWDTINTVNGVHTLAADARDAAGNHGTSSISVTVNNPVDSTPPVVSMTAPGNSSTVFGTIAVSASATDDVGVTGVQFKLDGANLGGEDTSAPYSVVWDTTTTANGSHSLTAVARDAAGHSTTATAVTVTVDNPDTTVPTVAITSPPPGSTVSGSAVTLTATATDNVGVAGVQFLLDGANLGSEDASAPYSVVWDTTAVADGNHTVTADARDAAGNHAIASAVTITVNNTTPDTTLPNVSITAPANGSTVSGSAVAVSASATDNVGVIGVQFKLDGANLGAQDTIPPYSFVWNTTNTTDGSHTLTAEASDGAGNLATSSVTVTVSNADTTPPTVAITSPASGSTVSGSAVTIGASATDNVSVAGVQFKVDGTNVGAEDATAPYSVAWDTTQATNGSHSLTAVARDAAGNSATATAITVSVNNVDATPPAVSITAPADGASVSGPAVTVSASATDNVGVVGVVFKLDGVNLGVEDTTAPYSTPWDTTKIANGPHALTVSARDAAGNVAVSVAVPVTVSNSTEFTFSIPAGSPSAATIAAGGTAPFTLHVAPAGFTGSVTFTCTGHPPASTCTVTPNPATVSGTDPITITVTITTTPRALANNRGEPWGRLAFLWAVALLPGIVLVKPDAAKRNKWRTVLLGLACLMLLLLGACGGGSTMPPPPAPITTGTPAGTYAVTVSGASGTVTHTVDLSLTVN